MSFLLTSFMHVTCYLVSETPLCYVYLRFYLGAVLLTIQRIEDFVDSAVLSNHATRGKHVSVLECDRSNRIHSFPYFEAACGNCSVLIRLHHLCSCNVMYT